MKSRLLCLPRVGCGVAAALLAALMGATLAFGQELAGTYADKGTAAAMGSDAAPTEASLHAIIGLQFDPEVNKVVYGPTARVRFIQGETLLEARMYDEDGELISRARWDRDEAYFVAGRRTVLRLRDETTGDDAYEIIFGPADAQGLMEVQVYRVSPGNLGPVAKRIGTYWFHRLN